MNLIVQLINGNHINIPANQLFREEGLVIAFNGHDLVAVIDIGSIEYLYLSERSNK